MKNNSILIAALAVGMTSVAQTPDEPVVDVIIGDRSAAPAVEIEFINNAPKRKNDNGLPRFAIVGNDHKYYLGVGLQFLGEAVFDFKDPMPSVYAFIPSSIGPRTPGNGGSLRFTAMTSSVYLNAVALPGTKNRVGLFFKAQINDGGDGYGFFVQDAYVTYRGLLAGYTMSLFTDGAAMPYTIDDQGPNGSAVLTVFTAGWTQQFTKNFSGAIGIDAPTASITTGGGAASVSQRAPAVPLYLQYGWGAGSHVRASALLRPVTYRDAVESKNRTPLGWGVQLSGLAQIAKPFTLYYSATYGRGIAQYLQDNQGLGLDAVPDASRPGRLELMKSIGVTGGFTCNVTKGLAINAVYSHVANMRPDGAAVGTEAYRYGDYVAANAIYTFNKLLAAGIEYDFGRMRTFGGAMRHSSRLQAQLSVTF